MLFVFSMFGFVELKDDRVTKPNMIKLFFVEVAPNGKFQVTVNVLAIGSSYTLRVDFRLRNTV